MSTIHRKLILACVLPITMLSLPCFSGAAPIIVPDQAVMQLDDLGLYSPGYALRGEPETRLPVGWISDLNSPTGAACESVGVQNGKESWLLHCPWRNKTGVTFQDFTFALPKAARITLSGDTALRADAVGKSDGATFRIFADGVKLIDTNRIDSTWQPFTIDLSKNSGKTVTLRFETDPGPKDNPSFDFSIWGDRKLTLDGFTPVPMMHPAPQRLTTNLLISEQSGSVVPPSAYKFTDTTLCTNREEQFRYHGADGDLSYVWRPIGGPNPLFGSIVLSSTMVHDRSTQLSLASSATIGWTLPAQLIKSVFSHGVLVRTFEVNGQTAHVRIAGSMKNKSLVFDISCDKPVISNLQTGDWGPVLRRRPINVPYYSQPVWYLAHENLFANTFLDWTESRAASLDRTQANYAALTDGTRNSLHERVIYVASWQVAEVLPNIPNTPSPYRADLSRRIMLDIWGHPFDTVRADLKSISTSGLGPAAAIIHVWQFGGYDNMLPKHVPANSEQGGDTGMAALVAEGKHANIRMALHENYVDYYPNYPSFNEADIARNSDGSDMFAWYNPGTKIQSFAVKPSRILALAATQSPEVMRRYGSNACYLDVHSAVPPWFHVDMQTDTPGAGTFQEVREAHTKLWAYERLLHHGPVFGEGNNHWYWSGSLDGVEAQFGQGWTDGTTAPLFVDFDLLKIHPLQLNHGMGYYERWWQSGPNTTRGMMSLLDQYRMQEIAYGHEGFLGGEAWHDPGLVWMESHLVPPVSARTALANPTSIDYLVNGEWLDTSTNAKTGGDWSRLHVAYSNGISVWANSAHSTIRVGSEIVPQYGWLAIGNGLHAGTTLRDGVYTDFAKTPNTLFANARPAIDWRAPGQVGVRPTITQFTPTSARTFRAVYAWKVEQSLSTNVHCLVHFVNPTGTDSGDHIVFQQDHALTPETSQWRAGSTISDGPWDVTVPENVKPGDYVWTIGLFTNDGGRMPLQGVSDQHSRIILGTLHVAAGGVSFTPQQAPTVGDAPINGTNKVIDFGTVRTNGSVYLSQIHGKWSLRPYPAARPFTIELSNKQFGHPQGVKVVAGWWTLNMTGADMYQWTSQQSTH